jgi:hypothetical protein
MAKRRHRVAPVTPHALRAPALPNMTITHALFVAALVLAWSLPEAPYNEALCVLIVLLHSRTWPPLAPAADL